MHPPDPALTQNCPRPLGVRTPRQYLDAHGPSQSQREPCDNPTHLWPENLAPFVKCREWLAPEVLEARRRQLGVPHRVLDILVPEVIL